jgi:hypothetical protein
VHLLEFAKKRPMNDKSPEHPAPIDYKGRTIVVNSHEEGDATWACQYSIVESGKPRTESITGHADGSFPSREAAELGAVQKAKALIDLR